jgi:hypothetical protein
VKNNCGVLEINGPGPKILEAKSKSTLSISKAKSLPPVLIKLFKSNKNSYKLLLSLPIVLSTSFVTPSQSFPPVNAFSQFV